ncbi:hypothetical protein KKF91_15625 [Myxococcota bacterium]|nr:hypothetical protein [Myxococcota bacterium]
MDIRLVDWWADVIHGPLFSMWFIILFSVFGFGLLMFIAGLFIWNKDRLSILHLNQIRNFELNQTLVDGRVINQNPIGYYPGVVGEWVKVLQSRRNGYQVTRSNDIRLIMSGRYDWIGIWMGYLRSGSLMVGLLFTFIGLGFTLKELATALQLSQDANNAELMNLVTQVRACLPSLATAFGSSVAGVIVAVLIGFFENMLHHLRDSIESKLANLSLTWLENRFAPLNSINAMNQLSDTIRDMSISLSDLALKNASTAELLNQGLSKMDVVAERIAESAQQTFSISESLRQSALSIASQVNEASDQLRLSSEKNLELAQVSRETSKAFSDVISRVETLFDLSAKNAASLQKQSAQLFKSQHDAISEMIQNQAKTSQSQIDSMHGIVARFNDSTKYFLLATESMIKGIEESAKSSVDSSDQMRKNLLKLDRLSQEIVTNFNLGGKHIQNLANLSKSFENAQNLMQDSMNQSLFLQKQSIQSVEELFKHIPIMAEAITSATVNQHRSSEQLYSILNDESMKVYLSRINDLIDLKSQESNSQVIMMKTIRVFDDLIPTLNDFKDQISIIGNISQNFIRLSEDQTKQINQNHQLYQKIVQEVENQYSKLIKHLVDNLENYLPTPVREIIQSAIEPQKQYIISLGEHVGNLNQSTNMLSFDAKKVSDELTAIRSNLENSIWSKIIKKIQNRNRLT